ncbi:MAG: hypothetical protein KDC18_01130 [Alphaproteobacteria bacterium]|nr:hypothetical protein [Alphaproteobacteria bacterium]MCB9928993.1 hypothetical protein [Alphaproteobacteria bacterium]
MLQIEGDNATVLFGLLRPERSETTRRNTNLFQEVIRVADDSVPFAEHLIHRTEKGHLVRSKSELVIANMLCRPDDERGWEWKLERHQTNGFIDGKTLFTSTEDHESGLDSEKLKETAHSIKTLLE